MIANLGSFRGTASVQQERLEVYFKEVCPSNVSILA
jgi:hypothetical protein